MRFLIIVFVFMVAFGNEFKSQSLISDDLSVTWFRENSPLNKVCIVMVCCCKFASVVKLVLNI